MTKWGMPGVYTHAFMDGWSPGYLGSVAYNHNGMMRMYETQSGRESGPGGCGRERRGGGSSRGRRLREEQVAVKAAAPDRAGRGESAAGRARSGRGERTRTAGRGDPAAKVAARRPPRRQPRTPAAHQRAVACSGPRRPGAAAVSRASGTAAFPIPPGAANNFSRRNNTNYMQTGVLQRAAAHGRLSQPRRRQLLSQDAELDRGGQDRGALRLSSSRCSAT